MKKRFLKLVGTVLTVSLLFAGCGNNSESSLDKTSVQTSSEPKVYSMKEALERDGASIWYMVEPDDGVVGKDSHITGIFIFENEQVYCYDEGDLSDDFLNENGSFCLGDATKVGDDDILERIQEDNIQHISEEIADRIKAYEEKESVSSTETSEYENWKSYKAVGTQPGSYELTVETDATGNNTETEILYFSYKPDHSHMNGYYGNENNIVWDYSFVSSFGPIQVYDATYAGYRRGYDEDDRVFITRVDQERFTLDTPTTDGIGVDLSDDEIRQIEEKLK